LNKELTVELQIQTSVKKLFVIRQKRENAVVAVLCLQNEIKVHVGAVGMSNKCLPARVTFEHPAGLVQLDVGVERPLELLVLDLGRVGERLVFLAESNQVDPLAVSPDRHDVTPPLLGNHGNIDW